MSLLWGEEMENKELINYFYKMQKLFSTQNEKIKQNTGLNNLPSKVLRQIYLHDNQASASYLSKMNGTTIAAMMHILYSLEEMGYLYKEINQSDNRQKMYVLTLAGKEQARKVIREFEYQWNNYLNCLDEKDKEALAKILEKTIKYMEAKNNA